MVYLCCTVSKLGQDFGSVVWDDAHGITGQVEFLQTGQRADVPDLLQLQTHTHTHIFHKSYGRMFFFTVLSWFNVCIGESTVERWQKMEERETCGVFAINIDNQWLSLNTTKYVGNVSCTLYNKGGKRKISLNASTSLGQRDHRDIHNVITWASWLWLRSRLTRE